MCVFLADASLTLSSLLPDTPASSFFSVARCTRPAYYHLQVWSAQRCRHGRRTGLQYTLYRLLPRSSPAAYSSTQLSLSTTTADNRTAHATSRSSSSSYSSGISDGCHAVPVAATSGRRQAPGQCHAPVRRYFGWRSYATQR